MGKLELFTPKFKERIVSDRSGGERISRNNNLRDALYQTAGAAGLAPVREGRFLLPGTDAAMDVTIVTPLQAATMPGGANTAGHALNFAYGRSEWGRGGVQEAGHCFPAHGGRDFQRLALRG